MLDMTEITNRLIFHEGLSLMPYKDSQGLTTIGVGRCVENNPFTSEELKAVGDWKHGITRNAALYLLRNDVKKVYHSLKKEIEFFKDLDSERQYALLDMGFNLGVSGLLRFKKMINALKYKDFNTAATECLDSKYALTVKTRAHRIAETLRTGIFKK